MQLSQELSFKHILSGFFEQSIGGLEDDNLRYSQRAVIPQSYITAAIFYMTAIRISLSSISMLMQLLLQSNNHVWALFAHILFSQNMSQTQKSTELKHRFCVHERLTSSIPLALSLCAHILSHSNWCFFYLDYKQPHYVLIVQPLRDLHSSIAVGLKMQMWTHGRKDLTEN